ncbi:putative olfactory receptor 56B2 [Ornithorhynchus anatinus]|uniref:G-protein coupled receptors family 1 profile domain-containing protein n=1 Tax=Ornithorhynchus anatinus TaxID=9258 RepID=A0A6I8N3G9_ORNAN|nr:putative olfactory receptor 56B2 [Ornithorhynchus anatinus]
MFVPIRASNGSSPQVTEFILMGFPGIHSWQHWLSLPLALLYLSALLANAMILLIIWQKTVLHHPMFYFLAVLALVDMGLSTTIMPRILAMLWFNARTISLQECFFQIYAIHVFVGLESGIFLCMAIDRYVAICHPLRYPSVITEGFVLKATLFMVFRNVLLAIPLPILATKRHYCSKNEIGHCLCSNLAVTSLACDDWKINSIFQLSVAWVLMGSDVGLIIFSYTLILRAVLKLHSAEAASKALSTCSSHIILILFFYTAIVVMSITHSANKEVPLIPVLLNVLHNVIPPALNPIVYALRTQEIKVGILKLIRLAGER